MNRRNCLKLLALLPFVRMRIPEVVGTTRTVIGVDLAGAGLVSTTSYVLVSFQGVPMLYQAHLDEPGHEIDIFPTTAQDRKITGWMARRHGTIYHGGQSIKSEIPFPEWMTKAYFFETSEART